MEFAEWLRLNPGKSKKPIKDPAVIGAVLDLGFCLDLLDYQNLSFLKEAHSLLVATSTALGKDMPVNKAVGTSKDLIKAADSIHVVLDRSAKKYPLTQLSLYSHR